MGYRDEFRAEVGPERVSSRIARVDLGQPPGEAGRAPWAWGDAVGALDSVVGSGVDDAGVRTSELAGQAGVNPETLRYYERRGLLDEPLRSPGGYRDYPDAAVELLRFIKRAQELGSPSTRSRSCCT